MFTDINKFKQKLKKLIKLSFTKLTFKSKGIEKEYLSLKRFGQYCIDNNIIYKRNPTNSAPADGTINGHKFQAKYISVNTKSSLNYQVKSSKSSGSFNGVGIHRQYEEGDFDYFVIEVGGTRTNESIYENIFCIIPAKILIEQNILKTATYKGKKAFCVCPPDYKKPHWSKEYWNVIPPELYKPKHRDTTLII
jgi:hypothetical protein